MAVRTGPRWRHAGTGSARTFVLLAGAVAALRQQRDTHERERLATGDAWKDGGLVFTTPTGAALIASTVDHVL